MATQTPLPIFSKGETLYVPQFEVYVGGNLLQDDVIKDVLQVTYRDSLKELDFFELQVNNCDAYKRAFKFAATLPGYQGMFDPGQRIEIRMGYQGSLRRM